MPKVDIPAKRLIQIRTSDWVKMILPGCQDEWITELKPDKVPKVESRLDSLLWIKAPENSFILNIEPQGYLDIAMPARMLRYRADIWEYTMNKRMGIPSVRQVVIFFFQEHDNKINTFSDKWDDKSTIEFNYEVVKVWELNKKTVIENKLIGLYPLLPLMKNEAQETSESIIELTIKVIETVKDEALRADLFASMSILTSSKYSREIVKKYSRREMLMESPLFNEWVEEERKEAAKEAAKEATNNETKKRIIDLLEERFDFISRDTRVKIGKINDKEILDNLFRKAIRVLALEDFEKVLEKAIRI